jgi:cyclic pyranopterin phosphate synthase
MELRDAHGRAIRDLRISLTDRCNFRCTYCLPHGEPAIAAKESILTFEETARLAGIFVSNGIEKIRLTGGEPLVRRRVPDLVRMLSALKPGLRDLALTTNGYDLPRHIHDLKLAGLDRVTISLDSLDRGLFTEITGVDALERTLAAIRSAADAGFAPIKINAVIVRGRNETQIVPLARFARDTGHSVRFIEFMPLDSSHAWSRDQVVSGAEIRAAIEDVFPLELREPTRGSSTAWNYRFADGSPGEVGIIAPVTESFCGACSRIRLTADGKIRTCLFSTREHDLLGPLRKGASDDEIASMIANAVWQKEPGHNINEPEFVPASRSMSFIGG